MSSPNGTLYVVATPIGNLEDITLRALRVLGEVDRIAAEDTRRTRKLLTHHGLSTPLTSYHAHNEREKASKLVERLVAGESIALVSDGGTPCISDPGHTLIGLAIAAGVPVVPIPGACALVAAACTAGLPLHEFFFAGFCSPKSGRRRRRLESLRSVPSTLIFYESPHRVKAFLRDVEDVLGPRDAVAARELTKIHEEAVRGTVSDLLAHFESAAPRGEFTILIAPEARSKRNESNDGS